MARTSRWDPLRDLEALRQEMDKLFEDFGFGRARGPSSKAAFTPRAGRGGYPLLSLSGDKDNLYVEALAPGVDPETLELTVQHSTLRIAGEKQALSGDIKAEAYHRQERGAGRFARTVDLPAPVDTDKIRADYRNGMLLITLPKTEDAKPKQINVKVS